MENLNNNSLNKIDQNAYKISIDRIFGGDNFFVFIYKKTEKILLALYLVSDFLKDEEPIKWKLRNKTGSVLSDIVRFYNMKDESVLNSIAACIAEVMSLLEVSEKNYLISSMNVHILKGEFSSILEAIYEKNPKSALTLPADFFEVGILPQDIKYASKASFFAQDYKGQNMSFNTVKKDISHESAQNKKSKEINLNTRKETIISIIKKSKEVTIKDITAVVHDCSEKTIQRDLLALVSDGVLKRTGERRWSRYQLV